MLQTLLIVFIVLKIIGVITWPWAIVLWPLWVMLGVTALIVFFKIIS